VVIEVTKKGPTQAVEPNKEFTFTLTPAVKSGPVTSMVLTDTIDASTGISFVKVSPATGKLLLICSTLDYKSSLEAAVVMADCKRRQSTCMHCSECHVAASRHIISARN
jgi:hypothetical protein